MKIKTKYDLRKKFEDETGYEDIPSYYMRGEEEEYIYWLEDWLLESLEKINILRTK